MAENLGGKRNAGAQLISQAVEGQNGTINNDIGFSALPGGMRFNYGDFSALGMYRYWCSTEYLCKLLWPSYGWRGICSLPQGLIHLIIESGS